jgi:cell division protease FtsH
MATTTTPVTTRQLPLEPENPNRKILLTAAYVLEHNLRRMIILAIAITLFVFFAGSVRNALAGVVDFVGTLPGLVIGLVFSAFALIGQFAFLMFFLSRPRTYTVLPDAPQIGLSFENYRGQPDLLDHAKSLVRILRGQESFKKLGGDMPKGMLLSGPPGTGKTFLAGVVAAEANLPFIYVDASSLRSMWMGVDALIIMSLFSRARKLARKYAPPGNPGACILFMDEIDSIGQSRGGVQGGQTQAAGGFMGMGTGGFGLNTLLNQMDSLAQHVEDRNKQKLLRWLGVIRGPVPAKPVVFVMGATNRPDTLDAALVRPGRLDRRLNVYAPDADGRRDILRHYLTTKAHDPNITVELMVSDSIGWTPIDIKTVINEALIVAHDAGRDFLNYKDWLSARDTRLHGIKQPILSMSAHDRRTIAYHEAGHAIVSHYVCKDDRIQKASIIRAGDAYGFVQPTPKEERHQLHAEEIESDIMMFLGSRAVEELILGTKTANASGDLRGATSQAMAYVGSWGMGSTLLAFPVSPMGAPPQALALADKLLELLYEETKRVIREKEYAVHAIAGALLQRGELIGPELDEIFDAADLSNPEAAKPFVRKPVTLPRMSDLAKENGGLTQVNVLPGGAVAPAPGPGPMPGPIPQPTPIPSPGQLGALLVD